jgi:hypothetical protein
VNRALLVEEPPEGVLAPLGHRHVGLEGPSLATVGADVGGGDDHVGAGLGDGQGDLPAQSPAGPGDERPLPVEAKPIEHTHGPFLLMHPVAQRIAEPSTGRNPERVDEM